MSNIKKYTWGRRTLTLAQWAKEPDIFLRGLDLEVLRARFEPEDPETAWDANTSFTLPVVEAPEDLRARVRHVLSNPRMRKRLVELVANHHFVPGGVFDEADSRAVVAEQQLRDTKEFDNTRSRDLLERDTEIGVLRQELDEMRMFVEPFVHAIDHIADVLEWAKGVEKDADARKRATDRLVDVVEPAVQKILVLTRKNPWGASWRMVASGAASAVRLMIDPKKTAASG